MLFWRTNVLRSSFLELMALAILGTSGCAPSTGSVSGTVTYKGKNLPYGRVLFVCADGTVVSGRINTDGTYTIPQAPVGLARVAVRCLEEAMPVLTSVDPSDLPGGKGTGFSGNAPQGPMMIQSAEKPNSRPKPMRIPDHFQQAEKSGLTYEIRRGDQTYDIKLE
jgi:hypothetical protein